jgi:hypothetical protein
LALKAFTELGISVTKAKKAPGASAGKASEQSVLEKARATITEIVNMRVNADKYQGNVDLQKHRKT